MTETDHTFAEQRLPISPDKAFVRTFADHAIAMDLGRDLDLSFLSVALELHDAPQRETGPLLATHVETKGTYLEVARVRIPPFCGFALAMEIFRLLIQSGKVERDLIFETLNFVEPLQSSGETEDTQADG